MTEQPPSRSILTRYLAAIAVVTLLAMLCLTGYVLKWHSWGMCQIGDAYCNGTIVKRDFAQAKKWYGWALEADQHNLEAADRLTILETDIMLEKRGLRRVRMLRSQIATQPSGK